MDSSSKNSEKDLVRLGSDYKDLLDCVISSLQTALTVQEKIKLVSVALRSGHPVPENVKTAVVEFYEDDGYSRVCPGEKGLCVCKKDYSRFYCTRLGAKGFNIV